MCDGSAENIEHFVTALKLYECHTPMARWKNEDDIKAELRVLTDELKHLRQELNDMVAPPKQHPTRAFLHRQAWPPVASRRSDVVGKAADKPPRSRGRRRSDQDK
jgi:hypothetical protein